MEKIILLKNPACHYSQKNFLPNNRHYGILIAFLNDCATLTNIIGRYKEYLSVGGNATYIYTENENVHIEFAFDVEGNPECVIPKKAFLQILDGWEEVLKNKPDQVIITLHDDQTATVEQIFEDKS